MKSTPSFQWIALVLLLSATACRQVPTAPAGLEPQFGTARTDGAEVVVDDPSRGASYVAGVISADESGFGGHLYLRRYNQNGSLAWERRARVSSELYPSAKGSANAVRIDAAGNVYLGWSRYLDDYGNRDAYLSKLSPTGKLLYKVSVDNTVSDLEVDAAGQVYLAGFHITENPIGANERYYLHKYDARGRLVWERARTYDDEGLLENPAAAIPAPKDIGLGGDGSLYVLGQNGGTSSGVPEGEPPFELTRYSSEGVTLWERAAPVGAGVVAATGQGFYLATNTSSQVWTNTLRLQRYAPDGSLLWERATRGLLATSLASDTSGSAYIAGYTGSGDFDLFARKYTASGVLSWRYQPQRVGTEELALDISAKDGRNVYLVGTTDAEVNGRNRGGYDAFLIRLDAQGKRVWSR